MHVKDIMTTETPTISKGDSIADAALKMQESGNECLVVVEKDEVIGLITERNLVFGCLLDGHISWKCHVSRHMESQTLTAGPNMVITEAVIMLVENELDNLPVVDDGKVIGLVSSRSFSRAIAMEMNRYPAGTSLSA